MDLENHMKLKERSILRALIMDEQFSDALVFIKEVFGDICEEVEASLNCMLFV
jgi:hypothetical protein